MVTPFGVVQYAAAVIPLPPDEPDYRVCDTVTVARFALALLQSVAQRFASDLQQVDRLMRGHKRGGSWYWLP